METERCSAIESLEKDLFDLLVIGGGIVGAGVARDAAMRGLKVALVDQSDFASGTSSRSSRLLHGGLRYLAQGRIGLVHEASVEKKIVHHIAPHLAEPLAFVFPTYRGNRKWVLWQLKIGVKIYDLLCGGRNLGRSSWLNRRQTLERIPALRATDLQGAVRYYDGLTNDARLVLDTLRSAARHGASLLNYCRFESHTRAGDHWECRLSESGEKQPFPVKARVIVNATGPWAQGLGESSVQLRLTKGVHLVVDREKLPVSDAVVMTEASRILFAIPWGARVILGTTDTDYHGAPGEVEVCDDDIAYLLKIANGFFPTARLQTGDVIGAWAGVRPLIDDARSHGNPSDISRSHEIRNPGPGWWDVAGGKLTTYRLMAEQTVDAIVRENGFRAGQCRTAREPLIDAADAREADGIVPPEFSRKAVEHYCRNEWAMHLDDVMIRRTSWHYYHPDAADKARQAASWMADLLSWDEATLRRELARYDRIGGAPRRQP